MKMWNVPHISGCGPPRCGAIDALPWTLACPLPVDRRAFLKLAAAASCLAVWTSAFPRPTEAFALSKDDWYSAVEARFYQKLPGKVVQCKLCPRECIVASGDRGYCHVRENRGGTYYSPVHSRVVAAHIDPVEKKPFFHFLPGSLALSVATAGCNVNCKFCQNWEISQAPPEDLRRHRVAEDRQLHKASKAVPVIAFTYNEPTVFMEYVVDAAEAGHELGIRSVLISCGFMNEAPLERLCKMLDAIKIDVKAFSEKYYREVVRGELKPVLDGLVTIRKSGTWSEIVYLVVPSLNDSDGEFRDFARWVKTDLGSDVPIHFTRFYPLYLLRNLPPTPTETLLRAKAIADAEGLQYVYTGNVQGFPARTLTAPSVVAC